MISVGSLYRLLSPRQRRAARQLLGLMLVGMLFEMVGVGLVVPVLVLLSQSNPAEAYPALGALFQKLGPRPPQHLIVLSMLLLAFIYLVKNLFLSFVAWRKAQFTSSLQADLSKHLFAVYLFQPYSFHLQRNSAQLIRNASGEITVFTANLILPGILLIAEGLVTFGLCALLLFVEPLGTILIVAVLSVAAAVFHRFSRDHITKWGSSRQFHEGMRLQHLQQGLGSVKDVKLLGREAFFLRQFNEHVELGAKAGQYQMTLLQLPGLWLELLAVLGLVGLVLTMILLGQDQPKIVPTLGLFAAAAFRLMPSANRMMAAVQQVRYGAPVAKLLMEEFARHRTPAAPSSSVRQNFQRVIEVDNIFFTYPGAAAPTISSVSLSIAKGEAIGFVGTSGSGKSTLVDLMLGLLAPDDGEIRVDGLNITEQLRNWQDQVGYVPQSIFLTDDTICRNVAFGISPEQIDKDAVLRALEAAKLTDFIATLPNGLDTVVGERGVRLSGGQRQRIGIARALYHNPSVLVLDEATSSLDHETEDEVMKTVNALHGAKTILIVAHRLSTVAHCDRLYRIEAGRLVETGQPVAKLTTDGEK